MRQLIELADEMLARYIDWREDAAAAADAYSRWRRAPAGECAWRFSAYLAALGQEESASISYAVAVTDLRRAFPSPDFALTLKGASHVYDSTQHHATGPHWP